MTRIIAEVVLVLALIGAGAFGWTQHKSAGASTGQVAELETKAKEAEEKLAEAKEELTKAQAEAKEQEEAAAPLKTKAQELDAVKGAFSGGEILKDLEANYSKQKGLSTERQLGVAAVRLLTLGSKDPSTIAAFQKTLELTDWKSRSKAVCAAQSALAAAGQKVNVMSECEGIFAAKAGADDHGKGDAKDAHAAPAGLTPHRIGITKAPWVLKTGAKSSPPAPKANHSHLWTSKVLSRR